MWLLWAAQMDIYSAQSTPGWYHTIYKEKAQFGSFILEIVEKSWI